MLISVAVGILFGFLAGLGTGGGSLLILYLTLVMDLPQAEARAINLLFFIPCALISCLFRWKQGTLKPKKILPAIMAGSISAAAFSFWGQNWDVQCLKKLFGLLLIFTAIRELRFRKG